MKITDTQMKTLLDFVSKTNDSEISCQTCEDHITNFAEAQLAGKNLSKALKAIDKHLEICPECAEELKYLCIALEDELGQ